MSLAKLRPVLYAGRCYVELPAFDRRLEGQDTVSLTAHYRGGELDVGIRRAGIGSTRMTARVSMFNIEHDLIRGGAGAVLEIPDVEDLHVVRFTRYHQELEVSITRYHQGLEGRRPASMPLYRDRARVSFEGLPEFFRWCSRATQINFSGGKLCGVDADELAVLCGIKPRAIGVQLNAFDGLELAGIDVLDAGADVDADVDADAAADTLQQGVQ